jgi:hypothetical protein
MLSNYMWVQEVSNDTDPLMWCKEYRQEFPRMTHMVRQYLVVSVIFVSPERLFISVWLVKSDLWGSLLDTTLNKHPKVNLKVSD